MYYTTPILSFRMKCHLCDNWFVIQTDPKVRVPRHGRPPARRAREDSPTGTLLSVAYLPHRPATT